MKLLVYVWECVNQSLNVAVVKDSSILERWIFLNSTFCIFGRNNKLARFGIWYTKSGHCISAAEWKKHALWSFQRARNTSLKVTWWVLCNIKFVVFKRLIQEIVDCAGFGSRASIHYPLWLTDIVLLSPLGPFVIHYGRLRGWFEGVFLLFTLRSSIFAEVFV